MHPLTPTTSPSRHLSINLQHQKLKFPTPSITFSPNHPQNLSPQKTSTMPTDTPLPLRLAQTLGITSSLLLGGLSAGMSFFTIPRLLESPTPLMLRQWRKMYIGGKHVAIPCAFLSSDFFLAFSSFSSTNPFAGGAWNSVRWSYVLSGVLSAGIIPFTLVVLMPTNNKLERKEEETRALEKTDKVIEIGI
jgi:hypothetical protein